VAATYPPIAKAAHVTGKVISIVTFSSDGSVSGINVISGPEMLKTATRTYIAGWKAQAAGGERNCPVVIDYQVSDSEPEHPFVRDDSQHVRVFGQTVCLCDPPADRVHRRRWYWPF
jgi:hypothetical protein